MLADAAQESNGKLYVMGGGWSIAGPGPVTMALAIKIEVPWDQANKRHHWRALLQTEDGEPVVLPSPGGEQSVEITGEFEVGRPPGHIEGTPLDLPLAINVSNLPLPPGRYEWRFTIDDDAEPDWHVAFRVRSSKRRE